MPTHTEDRVTMQGVSWEFYRAMLREVGDGHIRLTFNEGNLEIMSPSGFHENVKKTLGRLIETYADELGLTVQGLGSMTFSREDLQKGLEPDECYYVARAHEVIGKEDLDAAVDPPPDLAIEIDISRPRVARAPIYAALGVPEIWRFDGQRVVCLHRIEEAGIGARYVSAERSLAFPELSLPDLGRFIAISRERGQSAAMREFREWLRKP